MVNNLFEVAFIGRFQPFHNGHLSAVKQILAEHDSILIIIGSADQAGTFDNPFSFLEREEMINKVLKTEGISSEKYCIVALDDINNDGKWVDYLIEKVPSFNCVYTGSKKVKELFLKNGKKKVCDLVMLDGVSGTLVRDKMRKNLDFSGFVSGSLQNFKI
jgi:nicotinamide-nucleotide adenylyltransferase